MDEKMTSPLLSLSWVERSLLRPNDYNPNKVSVENLTLLTQSIFTNGWTLPIVARPDYTIIDGFHRWAVSGPDWTMKHPTTGKSLYEMLEGHVPVVIVKHDDESGNIYGTVTHNRARGTHLLEPMKAIVQRLLDEGKDLQEIGAQLGMKPEEVFRLSNFSKEQFLEMMAGRTEGYSRAEYIAKI